MINNYDIGDVVRLRATFLNAARAAADPTATTARVRAPNGTVTNWVYGVGADVVREEAGVFHLDVAPDAAGRWTYQWKGTGAVQTLEEGHFLVRQPEIV